MARRIEEVKPEKSIFIYQDPETMKLNVEFKGLWSGTELAALNYNVHKAYNIHLSDLRREETKLKGEEIHNDYTEPRSEQCES